MALPGWNLHPLTANLAGHWAVTVNGNWRMTFAFEGEDAVVCALSTKHLFKSMRTKFDHTVWQDVYHAMTPVGEIAYIKVTGYTDGRPPVIQFKRLEDAS